MMNITLPIHFSETFFKRQDEYLQSLLKTKEVVDSGEFAYVRQVSLWKGDITLLRADAIVNACNESLLGCFVPLHHCVDNAIHSFAGLQVRRDLLRVVRGIVPNGQVTVTNGYNLPSSYIFHTVGPKAFGHPTAQDEDDLRSCYLSCLRKADKMHLRTLAFCSIATGIYGFPIEEASAIAIKTALNYLRDTASKLRVIFVLHSQKDYLTYEQTFRRIAKEI